MRKELIATIQMDQVLTLNIAGQVLLDLGLARI